MRRYLFFVLFAFFLVPAAALGQIVKVPPVEASPETEETLIALDPKVGPVIDAAENARFALFPDREGFVQARVFQDAKGGYHLEIEAKEGSILRRSRAPLSAADKNALAEKIADIASGRGPAGAGYWEENPNGKNKLLVYNMLVTLGYFGWTIPVALEMEETAIFTTELVGGAAAFFLTQQFTRSQRITRADAFMTQYPGLHGIAQGWYLYFLLSNETDPLDPKVGLWLSTGLSLGASVSGFLLSRTLGIQPGQAYLLSSSMVWGYLYGFATAAMIAFADVGYSSSPEFSGKLFAGLPLLFADTLGAASIFYWSKWKATEGAVVAAEYLALVSAYAMGYILDLLGLWEKGASESIALLNTNISMVLCTHFAAYVGAMQLSRAQNLSAREGGQIRIATAAGFLLGLGLDWITGLIESRTAWPALPLAGAIGGWLWTYRSIVTTPDRETSLRNTKDGWQVQLDPAALAINAMAGNQGPTLPVLRASCSF